jgi:hypothetical protein
MNHALDKLTDQQIINVLNYDLENARLEIKTLKEEIRTLEREIRRSRR